MDWTWLLFSILIVWDDFDLVYSDIGLLEEETCQVTTNQLSTVQSELRSTNHLEELKKNAYHNGANIENQGDEGELKKGDCKCI